MTEASNARAELPTLLETPLSTAVEDADATLADLARSVGLDAAAFADGGPVVAVHDGLEMTLTAERGLPRLLMSIDLDIAPSLSAYAARRLLRANLDWMQTAGGIFAKEDAEGSTAFFRIAHVQKDGAEALRTEIAQSFAVAAAWRHALRDLEEDEREGSEPIAEAPMDPPDRSRMVKI